jgi:hypothetical protein
VRWAWVWVMKLKLKGINCESVNLIHLFDTKERWRVLVNNIMNNFVSLKAGNLLTS